MSSAAVPVLLDTDMGSDIDDAVCLAYLLRQPRCELLGVTTVSGDVRARAALASAVCRAAGRPEVPIHAGVGEGLLLGTIQPDVPQAAVLPRFSHQAAESFPAHTAVEFLRRTIQARPGEITLLAIGPMTNLGLLVAGDPGIASKLKRLVLMCGVFTNRLAGVGPREWNALCDPLATALTYAAHAPEHISIGLDVTCRCRMESGACIRQFRESGGPLEVVAAMTEVWASHREKVTFHDPLAAAVIFEPGLCQYQDGQVEVELKSEKLRGMTHFSAQADAKPHRIAVDVQPELFFEHYFSTVKKA